MAHVGVLGSLGNVGSLDGAPTLSPGNLPSFSEQVARTGRQNRRLGPRPDPGSLRQTIPKVPKSAAFGARRRCGFATTPGKNSMTAS